MNVLVCVFGALNLLGGLYNAVKGRNGKVVLNAIGFGICLYYVLERMV